MSPSTIFPLSPLPTIAENLDSIDSRLALRYMNTLMKNTLIRGLNTVYELTKIIDASHPDLHSFLEYSWVVCDMLRLHIEGDELFFTFPNIQGRALDSILGSACNLNGSKLLYNALNALQCELHTWKQEPKKYCATALRDSLDNLGKIMLPQMIAQVNAMKQGLLENVVTDSDLRAMIQENIVWLASHSDITYLLPFVLSHHDPKTSAHWPVVAPEGLNMIPDLVRVHAPCWRFAPVDPITKQARPKRAI